MEKERKFDIKYYIYLIRKGFLKFYCLYYFRLWKKSFFLFSVVDFGVKISCVVVTFLLFLVAKYFILTYD